MLNAEKVVNPPHMPVVRNVFQLLLNPAYLNPKPANRPINKQPMILINNVAK